MPVFPDKAPTSSKNVNMRRSGGLIGGDAQHQQRGPDPRAGR